jgi:predicted nucleotidyltransferase
VSVVDHRSRVPEIDRAMLIRFREALDRDGVAAAFIFGSRARGRSGPLSDVDLAVVLSPGVERAAAGSLRLDLARAAGEVLGSGEVDVVLADLATPLLRHRIARDGKLIIDRDPRTRIAFQADALRDYLDTASLRDRLREGIRQRLEEDRFGRP